MIGSVCWRSLEGRRLLLKCAARVSSSARKLRTDETLNEVERKRQVVQAEYQVYKAVESDWFPSSLTADQLDELISFDDRKDRLRTLMYLGDLERKREERQQRNAAKINDYPPERFDYVPDQYSLWQNTVIRRVRDAGMERIHSVRMTRAWAEPHSPRLVLDFGLTATQPSLLSPRMACAQLALMHRLHLAHPSPARMYWTDMQMRSNFHYKFSKLFHLHSDASQTRWCPLLYPQTEASFIDLFPRQDIVYLHSTALHQLGEVDSDKVYVMSLTPQPDPVMDRVKRLGVRVARFPFEKYVRWRRMSKQLFLHHNTGLMLDMLAGGDWHSAILKHVPPSRLAVSLNPEDRPETVQKAFDRRQRMDYLLSLFD